MRTLPLKYKLVLAPGVLIIPVIFVIYLMLSYLEIIGEQNDKIREWASTTDQLRIASSSIQYLQKILPALEDQNITEREDILFNYIEHSRLLKESITHPILQDKISKEKHSILKEQVSLVRYQENLDIPAIAIVLSELAPIIENLNGSLSAQKRTMYIDSNEYIKENTKNLAVISSSVLGLCVILGLALSFWITRSTTTRIKNIAKNANSVCDRTTTAKINVFANDELDELAYCLTDISKKIINNIATEKLLEGAEDERRRIAMDIHDQFLSDLNHFKRELELASKPLDKQVINNLFTRFDEIAHSLRGIIDDLHPQSLEMFGLEAAIHSYINRKLSGNNHPDCFIHIEQRAEMKLSPFQKLSLYRIILESINNIIKHAHCTRYEIDLRETADSLILSIEDNGIGMNFESSIQKSGNGLFNVLQRAQSINATATWTDSRFSSGTKIKLELPAEYLQQNVNKIAYA